MTQKKDAHLKVSSSLTMSDFSKLRAMLPERTPYISIEEMERTAEAARNTRLPMMAEPIKRLKMRRK